MEIERSSCLQENIIMIFLFDEKILLYLLIVPLALIFLLIIIVLVIRLKKYNEMKKVKDEEVDPFQQNLFYEIYGGKENIKNVAQEMSRVTVEVVDVEKVDLQRLKEFGASGVLVTGKIVKAGFGDRAKYIYKLLK